MSNLDEEVRTDRLAFRTRDKNRDFERTLRDVQDDVRVARLRLASIVSRLHDADRPEIEHADMGACESADGLLCDLQTRVRDILAELDIEAPIPAPTSMSACTGAPTDLDSLEELLS